jgi:hypothetical protein
MQEGLALSFPLLSPEALLLGVSEVVKVTQTLGKVNA